MKKTIGKLLHVANSYPDAVDKAAFYRMKSIILKRLGTRDGFDIQHIKGKKCFTCGGSGIYTGYHFNSGDEWNEPCWRCWGGWYKRPVWVVLDRYRLGGFVFHQPACRLYGVPPSVTSQVSLINGYIEHRDYGFDKPRRACLILAVMFAPRLLADYYAKPISDKWRRIWQRVWRDTEIPF